MNVREADLADVYEAVTEAVAVARPNFTMELLAALERHGLRIMAYDNPHTVHVFDPGAKTCSIPGCTWKPTIFVSRVHNVGLAYWDET